jgi:DNA-binding CsgD family transcriptional regulator
MTSIEGRLRDLYVLQGYSTYEIGRILGYSRQHVNRLLRAAGIEQAARGRGRTRRRTKLAIGEPATIIDMYVRKRLTTHEIGSAIHLSANRVRQLLREQGVHLRSPGGGNREDRVMPSLRKVEQLYIEQGLSSTEVGRRLGCSHRVVLRLIHDMGWPVRLGERLSQGPEDIELIRSLYSDRLVAAALDRHGIGQVAAGGPIWRRFPEPVLLTPAMVTDLYVGCGLSTRQMELLTGQPGATIVRRLRDTGVALRPQRVRSPFFIRWRTSGSA